MASLRPQDHLSCRAVCRISARHAWSSILATALTLTSISGAAQEAVTPQAPPPQPDPALPGVRKTAADKFYLQGLRAMEKGDARSAEKAFARAVQADPSNPEYQADWQITREHGITQLIQEANKARLTGHTEVTRAKLAEALALDPKNPEVSQHIDDLADLDPAAAPESDATVTLASPIELAPRPPVKQSFHLKAPRPEVLRKVLASFGIVATVDASITSESLRFDADDIDFAEAVKLLGLATDSFLVPLDPKRVLIARDTKDNRTQYERVSLETLRLPGLSPAEMTDMGNIARNVIGVQQASMQANSGTMTIRAPAAQLMALNETYADLLDGKSEVLLNVRMYQIAKTRTRNMGLQLPQSVTVFNVTTELNSIIQSNQSLVQQIISSGLANAGDLAAIAAILIASGQVSNSILGQSFALFGNGLSLSGLALGGGVTGNLNLNSSDTRALDQVDLRLDDSEEGTIRSGMRYPIVTSSYSSIGASPVNIPGISSAGLSSSLAGLGVNLGGLSAQPPIPQVQYQDVGLTLKVTPRIETTDEVMLKLDFSIQAIEGSTVNGLPVLTNRSYTADVGLHNGASVLVVGDLTRQESKAVSGVPGLSELPGFQSTTNSSTELDVSDLVILVTPRILRRRQSERAGPVILLSTH